MDIFDIPQWNTPAYWAWVKTLTPELFAQCLRHGGNDDELDYIGRRCARLNINAWDHQTDALYGLAVELLQQPDKLAIVNLPHLDPGMQWLQTAGEEADRRTQYLISQGEYWPLWEEENKHFIDDSKPLMNKYDCYTAPNNDFYTPSQLHPRAEEKPPEKRKEKPPEADKKTDIPLQYPPPAPTPQTGTQSNNQPATNAVGFPLAATELLTQQSDPIITANGEELLALTDFTLPCLTPFRWTRTYRSSQCDQDIGLGYGWRSNFHLTLTTETSLYAKNWIFTDEQGRRIPFTPVAIGAISLQTHENMQLHYLAEDRYQLYRQDGSIGTFALLHKRWRLTQLQDALGRMLQFFYNTAGGLIRILYHPTRGIELILNPQNHLQQIRPVHMVDGDAQVLPRILAEYQYQDNDLQQTTNADNQTEKYGYIQHLIRFRVRATGYCYRFDWEREDEEKNPGPDPNAKCLRVWGLDGVYDTSFAYHAKERLTIVTDARGGQTHFHHDALGRVIRKILANDCAWGYAYADNQLVRETLPSGAQKQWKYAHNVLQESIDANGCSRRYEHEAHNLIVTDEQGQEWVYQRTADGLLENITAPDGSITSIEYNADKLPSTIRLPGRPLITLTWSPIGQLLRLQQGAAVTKYTYAADTDALHTILDPNGLITEFIRNEFQQIIILRQYPKNQPQVMREHHFTRKNGRLIDKTDPLGRKTRYRHSNFSQVSQQTNPDGGLLSYQRDRERNLIGIQRDNQTESYNMVYDLVENRIETIGFDARAQQYGFDADNRLHSVMDAEQRSIKVQRDRKGNILQQSAQHNGQTHNNCFTWDKADKLTQADNAQRNINIQHQANGLPESIEQDEWRIAKQYDDAARIIELWLPDGDVIGFDFDDQGLSQISRNEKPLLIFHRDVSGREILCEQANGVVLKQAWYPFGELAAQEWTHNNLDLKQIRAYYYNQQQLIKIGDSEQGDTEYTYDPVDQLLQVTGIYPEKFCWDAFGNPKGDDIGVYQDRLGIKGEKRYQHDGSGNQIAVEIESPNSGLFEAIEQREFNGFNQLTRFSDGENANTYEYDALHRRSAKINQHGRTDFLWDGPYLIGEVRDGLFTWWIYDPGTFRPLLMIENGKVYYYHTDHLGTPLKLTDENAEVVWMATYSAFGKATILVEKVKQPLRFPGQYYDEESGLCSNGFRYYDSELGRYITQDPIGLAGGLNPYQYAPNPIMWIDPTGLICKEGLKKQLTEQFQWLGAADVDSFITDLLSEQGIPYARVAGQTRINAVAKSNIGIDDQLSNINDQLMVIATTASTGATTEVPLKELVRHWTLQNRPNKTAFVEKATSGYKVTFSDGRPTEYTRGQNFNALLQGYQVIRSDIVTRPPAQKEAEEKISIDLDTPFYLEPETEAQKSVNAMSNYALHLEAFRRQFNNMRPDEPGVVNSLLNQADQRVQDPQLSFRLEKANYIELTSVLSQIGMTPEDIIGTYETDGPEGLKAAVDKNLTETIKKITALAKRMDAFVDSPQTTDDDVAEVFLNAPPEFFQQLGTFDAGLESLLPYYGNAVSAQAVDKLNLDIDVLETMNSIGFISQIEMNTKIEAAQDNRNIELAGLGIVGLGGLAKLLAKDSGKIKGLFSETKLGDKLVSPVGRFVNSKFLRIAEFLTQVLRQFGLNGKITQAGLDKLTTQKANANLIASLKQAHPDLSNRDIADLAKPNLELPDVPHGFTKEKFVEAQNFIKNALKNMGLDDVKGFATGSRVTGVTTNPKKSTFGELISDFSRRDLDITLINNKKISKSQLYKISVSFYQEFNIKLGIRYITEVRQLKHIPVFGKIDLGL